MTRFVPSRCTVSQLQEDIRVGFRFLGLRMDVSVVAVAGFSRADWDAHWYYFGCVKGIFHGELRKN